MQIDNFLILFKGVGPSGDGWSARCPAHEDRNASLSIANGDKGIVIKCHAGCDSEKVVQAVGLGLSDLFPEDGKSLSFTPRRDHAHVHTGGPTSKQASAPAPEKGPHLTVVNSAVTLADYAKAKALPVPFLTELGIKEKQYLGKPSISIPYLSTDGRPVTTRYRIAMVGDRFRWRSGSKPVLYGLWRLEEARKAGSILIVEGESDCHTAWHHDIPAVGLPGAANWREERDAHNLDGIEKIYVIVEPDAGGRAVLKWISSSSIKERVHIVDLGQYKDLSDLHLAVGDGFDKAWQDAVAGAKPFADLEAHQAEAEHEQALNICGGLLNEADILAKFSEAIAGAGVVGETKTAKLVYLALTSRFFLRPISIVLKGPSSAGKSFVTERVLSFFPPDASYALTAMSDRALAYSAEPLEHRFIVIYEAAGLESDFATYLLRSLLSEGCVRYETVEKTSEGMKPRLIERKGPTGCLLTTTAPRLHPENETRMLSITISDSREQTRVILDQLAEEKVSGLNLEPWVALQTWLKGASHRVTIPYAKNLAGLVPEVAVRLRRDFHHVLTLIKSHALVHQRTREKDKDGRIIATIADYRAIYDLVADVIADGVETTVRPEVRQTVEAVKTLRAKGHDSVTVKQVAEVLGLDASTVSRRVAVAQSRGYLKNEETRRRMPAKLDVADNMPLDAQILPDPDRLGDSVYVCTSAGGDKQQKFMSEPMVEEIII